LKRAFVLLREAWKEGGRMDRVPLEKKVLSENDRIAADLRARFGEHGILCLNFVSSPGAGKTTLLEQTLARFARSERVAVLTGDVQTDNDARRLARFGFPVKQITTGGACHLDARMIERALFDWRLEDFDLLFIENVGNLVCPASYDLGEAAKIVVLSVTEGDDKPLKYPAIFFRAELLILSKTDLLPHVPFSMAAARENARRVHPEIEILEVSASVGTGMETWLEWLEARRRQVQSAAATPATARAEPAG
jgi:hydrogenase nickel incorporation protein HypB